LIVPLLDSGVIGAGDGESLGVGLLALLVGCTVIPLAFAVAWSILVHFVEGTADD